MTIDHRAEAQRWLDDAEVWTTEDDTGDNAAMVSALIGIGHALLAGPEPVEVTMAGLTYTGPRPPYADAVEQALRTAGTA